MKLTALLIFILVISSLCSPYLFRDLRSEEGYFILMAFYKWKLPDCGIMGREDGQLKRIILEHPAFPYMLMRAVGYTFKKFIVFTRITVGQIGYIVGLRSILWGVNILLVSLIFWFCVKKIIHPENIWIFTVFALALFSSVFFSLAVSQIHYEAFCLPLFSFSLLCLLFAEYINKMPAARNSLLIIAGCLTGLCKNEWSLALAAAVGLVLFINRSSRARVHAVRFFVGIIVGNFLSYLLGAENYLGGFKIMTDFSLMRRDSYMFSAKLAYLKFWFSWFWREIILVFSFLFIVGKKRGVKEGQPEQVWLYKFVPLFVIILIGLYLAAAWFGDGFPRYFMMCLPFVLTLLALRLTTEIPRSSRQLLFIIAGMVLILNLCQHFLDASGFKSNRVRSPTFMISQDLKRRGVDASCIHIVPAGVGWYVPDLNFFHYDLQEKFMVHDKPLCDFPSG